MAPAHPHATSVAVYSALLESTDARDVCQIILFIHDSYQNVIQAVIKDNISIWIDNVL